MCVKGLEQTALTVSKQMQRPVLLCVESTVSDCLMKHCYKRRTREKLFTITPNQNKYCIHTAAFEFTVNSSPTSLVTKAEMKTAKFIFSLKTVLHVVNLRKTKAQHATIQKHVRTNTHFQHKKIFSYYFEKIKSAHNLFFLQVDVEQLLNPLLSVHLASLTGLGSCTRPLLMPADCL